jgi:hypothetical protein
MSWGCLRLKSRGGAAMDIFLKADEIEELKSLMAVDEYTGTVEEYAREVLSEGMSYHKARQPGGYLHPEEK